MNKSVVKECLLAEEPTDCGYCCCRCTKEDCPVRCERCQRDCENYAGQDPKGWNYLRLVA